MPNTTPLNFCHLLTLGYMFFYYKLVLCRWTNELREIGNFTIGLEISIHFKF